jgi:GAF domain-containing protein
MAESFEIPTTKDKNLRYKLLYDQAKALLSAETNQLANMANLCSVLKYVWNFFGLDFIW